MDQQDKISILGPRDDGTYVVEFRTAEGKKLAITVPKTKAAVLKHFQAATAQLHVSTSDESWPRSSEDLQTDLDAWLREYNEARPHQGRWCFGKTPMQTFLDALPMTNLTAQPGTSCPIEFRLIQVTCWCSGSRVSS